MEEDGREWRKDQEQARGSDWKPGHEDKKRDWETTSEDEDDWETKWGSKKDEEKEKEDDNKWSSVGSDTWSEGWKGKEKIGEQQWKRTRITKKRIRTPFLKKVGSKLLKQSP